MGVSQLPLRWCGMDAGLLNPEGKTQLNQHSTQNQMTKSYAFWLKKENSNQGNAIGKYILVLWNTRHCHLPETSHRPCRTRALLHSPWNWNCHGPVITTQWQAFSRLSLRQRHSGNCWTESECHHRLGKMCLGWDSHWRRKSHVVQQNFTKWNLGPLAKRVAKPV